MAIYVKTGNSQFCKIHSSASLSFSPRCMGEFKNAGAATTSSLVRGHLRVYIAFHLSECTNVRVLYSQTLLRRSCLPKCCALETANGDDRSTAINGLPSARQIARLQRGLAEGFARVPLDKNGSVSNRFARQGAPRKMLRS